MGMHCTCCCSPAAWQLAGWRGWRLTHGERIAAAICSSHKTAALGIPLIGVLFHGNPHLGLIVLPLVTYHMAENLLDGGLAAWFRNADRNVGIRPA